MFDVVYIVRPGEDNEELRYSLRSLRNLPHRSVTLVGHKPAWVTGVEWVPRPQVHDKPLNVFMNVREAVSNPRVPDEFLMFNDDFFVTEPVSEVPVLYRGSMAAHITMCQEKGTGWWALSLMKTQRCLREAGFEEPLSYELHVPLPVVKAGMAEAFHRFRREVGKNPPQWRSLYGNYCRIGGVQAPDVKANAGGVLSRPFHSTSDNSWHVFGLQEMFPERSPYELG